MMLATTTTLVTTRGIVCSVGVGGGDLLDDSDTASGTAGASLLRAPSTHSCWSIWLVLSKRGPMIRVSPPILVGTTPPPSVGGDAPGWVWGFFNFLFSRQGTGTVQSMWFGLPGKNSEILLFHSWCRF